MLKNFREKVTRYDPLPIRSRIRKSILRISDLNFPWKLSQLYFSRNNRKLQLLVCINVFCLQISHKKESKVPKIVKIKFPQKAALKTTTNSVSDCGIGARLMTFWMRWLMSWFTDGLWQAAFFFDPTGGNRKLHFYIRHLSQIITDTEGSRWS